VIDVPEIIRHGTANVYCSPQIAEKLLERGVPGDRIIGAEQGNRFVLNGFTAKPFSSRHVTFDRKLVLTTLLRGRLKLLKQWGLLSDYPTGGVLSWRFHIDSLVIHHFGSGGSTESEFAQFDGKKTDVLLVPLQGRTDISNVAKNYVDILEPAVVIPHHHDDFHPPISSLVDISPFTAGVMRSSPQTKIIEPVLGEEIVLPSN